MNGVINNDFKSIYDISFTTYSSYDNSISILKSSFETELEKYLEFINNFFSIGEEGKNIKSMYDSLHNISYIRDRVIKTVDVNYSLNIYLEYFSGMYEFVTKLINKMNNGENCDEMESQLQTALLGDSKFIKSLFNGEKNKLCDEPLTKAVTNIESLVDFFDVLKDIKAKVSILFEAVYSSDDAIASDDSRVTSIRLVLNSVNTFIYWYITTVIATYKKINNVLNNSESNVVKDDSESLKLF